MTCFLILWLCLFNKFFIDGIDLGSVDNYCNGGVFGQKNHAYRAR